MSVNITDDGPVRIVEIDRPEVRNAVNPETADRLRQTFRDFDKDDTAKVAVLTGGSGNFCAGYDLKALSGKSLNDIYEPEGDGPMGPTRLLLTKPVIAAVEGYAVAGGIELAAWCDMRVASETAIFGVFCRRWGVPLIDGGTIRLPRLIGHSHAMDLILTGRGVSGEEARMMGLANRLTPKGGALDTSLELAENLARFPQRCMVSDRLSSYAQWHLSQHDALLHETRLGMQVIRSGETREGASRFAAGAGRHGDFGNI